MNCDESRSAIGAYSDGELDLLRAVQIEEHLKECVDCANDLERQRALYASDEMSLEALQQQLDEQLGERSLSDELLKIRFESF